MLSKCSRGLRHALCFSTATRNSPATSTALRAIRRPTISILKTSTESFLSSTEFNSERKEKEEEEEEEGKGHDIVIDRNALPSLFVQPELLPRAYWDQKGMIKRRGHLEQHWVVIYAFLGLSFVDRLNMRSFCHLFHEVEKLLTLNKHGHKMLKPLPLWLSYPHPNCLTLYGLINKLNRSHAALPEIVWEECTAAAAAGTFSVGTEVRARFVNTTTGKTLKNLYPGKIAQIKNDDSEITFDIDYDDGDTRKNVPLNEIQIKNVSCSFVVYRYISF